MSAQLEVLFSDAQETLEQIELESHTLEPGGREKVKTRVTSYQAELKRQQNQVASSKTEAGERSDRLELLSRPGHGGGGGEEFQGGENSLLLAESEEILSEAGRQLHDGRRLLEETQEVGAGVLGDLHNQRETIQRSRSRLKDLEGGLGEVRPQNLCKILTPPIPSQSSSILGKMMWRAQQNKLVLAAVGIAVLLVAAYTVYHLATS